MLRNPGEQERKTIAKNCEEVKTLAESKKEKKSPKIDK